VPDEPVTLRAVSAMEEYELRDYAAGFERQHPGITVTIERRPTRALHAHLLGLGDTDEWDVLLGCSVTSVADPAMTALLDPLDESLLDRVPPDASGAGGRWIGPSGFVPAFCIAPGAADERDVPRPTSWRDLADPRWRGAICLPDPNVSGAGFLHLRALIEVLGHAHALQVMGEVARNRPTVVRSAFDPCRAVLAGEAAIGVTVSTAMARLRSEGHDVGSTTPSDACRYELEAFGINRRSPHRAAAHALLAWMAGDDAAAISASYGKVVTSRPGPADASRLAPIDVEAAATDRSRAVAAWSDAFSISTGQPHGETQPT